MATLLTRRHDDVLIVYFQDVRIIDETRIHSLGQELNDLVNDSLNQKILLNFQNVSFMSSAMIGKLIQFAKQCKSTDIRLRLCNINDNVQEVFSLMKLEKVFSIDESEDKAFTRFRKKSWLN